MAALTYNVVTDPAEAKKYWELFSPHKTIDDAWDFRMTFTEDLDFPFHFIVGFDNREPVGLLPLTLNTLKGLGPRLLKMDQPFLEFFGGIDTDDNGVFLKPGYEEHELGFYGQIPSRAVLTSLKKDIEVRGSKAEFYLDRFEMDLEGVTDFASYVDMHFSGKTRKNIRHELRDRLKENQVEVVDAEPENLSLLFQYSIDRFGERSSFNMEQRRNIYKRLMEKFQVDLFKVVIDGSIKAVGFGIVFKDSYIGINMGYDYSISNLGKFLITQTIPRAIRFGCKRYDTGQGDNGWKEKLHLQKTPQYKLVLN